jgi:multiple sugar transport system substrate-binding protein
MSGLKRVLALGLALVVMGCGENSRRHGAELQILWADWEPARALQSLSEEYTAMTGVKVKVIRKSWDGAFTDAAFSEFRNRADNYDILIGDSQWLGIGVVGRHYLELTDWMPNHIPMGQIVPSALKWYSEWPQGSNRYYAVPCEADAMGWVYRRDLFENPSHQTAFQAFLTSKGVAAFPLAVPTTWEELKWIAAYFHEKVPGVEGVALPTSRKYDMATMSFEQILWAFGGEFGDYANNRVSIHSPESVAALQYFTDLLKSASSGGRNMSYGDVTAQIVSGHAAMACTFFAFFPSLTSPMSNPDFYDKLGFFNAPGHKDAQGVIRRATSLGGQGMSINAHVSVKRQQLAKEFLAWFSRKDVQQKWAARGGITANRLVLQSDEFRSAAPYNGLFEEAFSLMKDFWSVPEFGDLMEVTQREICAVIQQGKTPTQSVKTIQTEHERILKARRWKVAFESPSIMPGIQP